MTQETNNPTATEPQTFDIKIKAKKNVYPHKELNNPHATEGEVLEILSLFNFEPLSGLIGVYGSETDLYNLIIS